ncbi:MAG: amidophosphoribosyltransferase, partial [Bacteroidetes bacterium]|nr:amidophosphoribosyltransferase [Bacteroidota bacterium]
MTFFQEKYGNPFYGWNKLYLLMEKQHNRGQDGAGVASIKLKMRPGQRYISRARSVSAQPIREIFDRIYANLDEVRRQDPALPHDLEALKSRLPYFGELLLGHLRYGTHGKNSIETCHPFLRQSNWRARNLVVAGNFNMTNTPELFGRLVGLGQHPKERADTVTVMENIGHFLDLEHEELGRQFAAESDDTLWVQSQIESTLDLAKVLTKASRHWDGGYAMAGMLGHGASFVLRDPAGIRPAYFYAHEEVVAVASERPPLFTAFGAQPGDVQEVPPGHALIIDPDGSFALHRIHASEDVERRSCSFERIYFSRGNDPDIYAERKKLGAFLVPRILEHINYDFKNTVFSYIPNTAEVAFYGMMEELNRFVQADTLRLLRERGTEASEEERSEWVNRRVRMEKVAIKDAKLRTFITDGQQRDDLVAHVYDTTLGIIQPGVDTLVVVDDSIVRGTTLRQSIIRTLARLQPKRMVIVSSAPQIRYPDCYGIDMSRLGEFIAFQAAVSLLLARNQATLLEEIQQRCQESLSRPELIAVNEVSRIYEGLSRAELEGEIARLITPAGL